MSSKTDEADIKIADFGFAKRTTGNSLTTPLGSPSYVAPEILMQKPYGMYYVYMIIWMSACLSVCCRWIVCRNHCNASSLHDNHHWYIRKYLYYDMSHPYVNNICIYLYSIMNYQPLSFLNFLCVLYCDGGFCLSVCLYVCIQVLLWTCGPLEWSFSFWLEVTRHLPIKKNRVLMHIHTYIHIYMHA